MLSTQTAEPPTRVEPPPAARRKRKRERPVDLTAGDKVGAWRVESELGRGGMGAVYAVTHAGFGKRAALKLCHKAILGPSFSAETFLREARVVHLVDHPGVCDVFATGTYDNRPYLALERLAGTTLGGLLDRGPLAPRDGLALLGEIAEVLAAAHAAGVVHRDLKLDNVFVLEPAHPNGRRIKLLDWGVAAVLGEDDPMRGMIAGTLTYVAPEQVRGEEITPAADVYSLAVLAYQVLFGAPPFAASNDLDLIQLHLRAEPPAPASLWEDIPEELAQLLTAMLDKQPAARPTIAEVQRVLREAMAPPRSWLSRLREKIAG